MGSFGPSPSSCWTPPRPAFLLLSYKSSPSFLLLSDILYYAQNYYGTLCSEELKIASPVTSPPCAQLHPPLGVRVPLLNAEVRMLE